MPLFPENSGVPSQDSVRKLQTWITYGTSSVALATLPANFFVDRINLHVQTAFNAGTTNNISVGYTGSTQAFGTNTAVGTTGRKTVTMGADSGLNTTARTITVYYSQSGSTATTGKAFVEVYAYKIPSTP